MVHKSDVCAKPKGRQNAELYFLVASPELLLESLSQPENTRSRVEFVPSCGRPTMHTRGKMSAPVRLLILLSAVSLLAGCSLRTYAINMVGDALASGDSVYETDEDLELVVDALPFGLKLTESLLSESPNHEGLLLTACRGFVLYTYANVAYRADVAMYEDIDRARALHTRAGKLYQRAFRYCLRGLERSYEGFGDQLLTDPDAATSRIEPGHEERDLPLLYWTAASLGLSISSSRGSAILLARLPEVEALVERALALDESWEAGTLHEFKVTLAGAVPGQVDYDEIRRHYDRALKLSGGQSAGLFVAYGEAVSVPTQNATEFREMMEKALAVDLDDAPDNRLVNQIAQRRAAWLLDRVDDLILDLGP